MEWGASLLTTEKKIRFIEQPRQEINKENAEQEKQLAEDVQNLSKRVCSSILPPVVGNKTVCVLCNIII